MPQGGGAASAVRAAEPAVNGAPPEDRIRPGPVSHSVAAERRQRVVDIATSLFLERGYAGTSIDEIARRSRVSKATIYAQWGTKEEMFRAFYTSAIRPFVDRLKDTVSWDAPLETVVRDVVWNVLRSNTDVYSVGLLRLAIAERDRFPSIAQMVFDYGKQTMQPLADYFRRQAGSDRMTEQEAGRYALHLLNLALGGSAVLLTDSERFYGDKEVWAESVTRIFLAGLPIQKGLASA